MYFGKAENMAKKINYYDIHPLLETCPDASYYILLGMRANGKSYQVKKTIIEDAYNSEDEKFVIIRRWQRDMKQLNITEYFDDMPVLTLTKGEYSGIQAYQGFIYFTKLDEHDKVVRSNPIGRYLALNKAEEYKSQAFVGYKNIVYEEFITDDTYLTDEPRRLSQLISTIARLSKLRVFMVGNTLSRLNPYFAEWSLEGALRMSPGEIQVYHFHMDDNTIDIAVEMCGVIKYENNMFFGQASKQIIKGEWDVHDLPKLIKPREYYDFIYEVMLTYQSFKFVIELLINPVDGCPIVHIYPYTKNRKIMRQLTTEFSDNIFVTSKLDRNKCPEQMIINCFNLGKICYSDNLTGTDFGHVLKEIQIW